MSLNAVILTSKDNFSNFHCIFEIYMEFCDLDKKGSA